VVHAFFVVRQKIFRLNLHLKTYGNSGTACPPWNTALDHFADLDVAQHLQKRIGSLEAALMCCQFIWIMDWLRDSPLHPSGIHRIPRSEESQYQQVKRIGKANKWWRTNHSEASLSLFIRPPAARGGRISNVW
jgi:hypothetical protein